MITEPERMIIRPFEETDCNDLYELLYQLDNDEFEGYPGITYENGNPIWKDAYVNAIRKKD